ncbi:hypothetical protein D3C74_434940 [compost metagenome]
MEQLLIVSRQSIVDQRLLRRSLSFSHQQLFFRLNILFGNIKISVSLRDTNDVIKCIVGIAVISNQVAVVSDRKTLFKSIRNNDNLLS